MNKNKIIENIKNELEDLNMEFSDYMSIRFENAHNDSDLHSLVYESLGLDKDEIDNHLEDLDPEIVRRYECIYTEYYKDLSDKLDSINSFEEAEKDPYFSDEKESGFYEKIKRGAFLEKELKNLLSE